MRCIGKAMPARRIVAPPESTSCGWRSHCPAILWMVDVGRKESPTWLDHGGCLQGDSTKWQECDTNDGRTVRHRYATALAPVPCAGPQRSLLARLGEQPEACQQLAVTTSPPYLPLSLTEAGTWATEQSVP